jgi:16S rRNA G966 N2-methylase RsmD
MKPRELANVKISKSKLSSFQHLNRQIPPEPHTSMYVWHKYWSRKTWNVVGEFIRHYSHEQEIVFDPFAGSGVVGIEAVRNKRRAIICDLNPSASLITELTLRPVNLVLLKQAFERVCENVKEKIEKLYEIHCIKCGHTLVAACFIRKEDNITEVRYPRCPNCEYRCESGHEPLKEDVQAIEAIEKRKIKEWYPQNKLYYNDDTPFLKKEHYNSLDQLFTHRNLQALAWLYQAIHEERNLQLRKFLLGAFTSMVHLCTRMCPAIQAGEGNNQTAFSSTWTQHSYWSTPKYMEQNVWKKFESAVIGHQGLMNAKKETEQGLPKVKLTEDWQEVLNGKSDIAIITGDCLELMESMPSECVDYVFTDPPYDASIQYGELSYLWNAWLKKDQNYLDRIATFEIIRNERQGKKFDTYYSLLSNSFHKFFKVLRPKRYLTVTFHNPTFKVRNATVRAGVFAGFNYQKVHHQPLGQVSAKSMLQPFGSAQGDFYLRFEKPGGSNTRRMVEITEERFRRIVIESCKQVIAERAEPTPYTILINYIDPILARHGFFSTLHTGLDIKNVLKESLGSIFRLEKTKIGNTSGELWWFNDPSFIARLKDVPLSERVEQTVFRKLNEQGRVTFTQIWNAVSEEFPNSLTSDTTSINQALEIYGRKVGKGYWLLRDEIRMHLNFHSEIIAILAMIGAKRGYDIWIGRNEQGTNAGGLAGEIRLSKLVTATPQKLQGVQNIRAVLDMDLLWLNREGVITAFEIEATTSMTSGLLRGSNLPSEIPKVMVLPEEREKDFTRKMLSPLFEQHFKNDSWQLLYFDTLRKTYSKYKDKTEIEKLFNFSMKKSSQKADYKKNHNKSSQLSLL